MQWYICLLTSGPAGLFTRYQTYSEYCNGEVNNTSDLTNKTEWIHRRIFPGVRQYISKIIQNGKKTRIKHQKENRENIHQPVGNCFIKAAQSGSCSGGSAIISTSVFDTG